MKEATERRASFQTRKARPSRTSSRTVAAGPAWPPAREGPGRQRLGRWVTAARPQAASGARLPAPPPHPREPAAHPHPSSQQHTSRYSPPHAPESGSSESAGGPRVLDPPLRCATSSLPSPAAPARGVGAGVQKERVSDGEDGSGDAPRAAGGGRRAGGGRAGRESAARGCGRGRERPAGGGERRSGRKEEDAQSFKPKIKNRRVK